MDNARKRIIILAQEDQIPGEKLTSTQEIPPDFGVKIGILAIMNFMKLVRYANSGLNMQGVEQRVLNDRGDSSIDLAQYKVTDPAIDSVLTTGGTNRQSVRVNQFETIFPKIAESNQFDKNTLEQQHQTASLFAPEPSGGSGGGKAPYDSHWTSIGQKFGRIIQEMHQERKKSQVPVGGVVVPPKTAALSRIAQTPAVQQPNESDVLGNKYESINELREELIAKGPTEQTYSDLMQSVGPDNEDSAKEALSSFFQGSAMAIASLYDMLISVGKASPIDSETVGELMNQHPELNNQPDSQAESVGQQKFAGLFMPNSNSTLTKLADSAAFPHYIPANAACRMCPKTRGIVPLDICRNHCLDGLVVDDTQVLCGEAIWRQAVMDKFSSEYRNEDGKWVGGYLNKRFHTERDDGGHPALLKPGQRSSPIHEDSWSTEKRLQEMRRSEGESRGYSKTPGDPKGLYNFDPYQEDKGPKNPQLFKKKQAEDSKTASFNLRTIKTANGMADPLSPDTGVGVKQKECVKCGKKCGPDSKICDNPNFNRSGQPCGSNQMKDVYNSDISGETGAIKQPLSPFASTNDAVKVCLALGVYKASKSGISVFASTEEDAIIKLAESLADLDVPSIEEQDRQLQQLRPEHQHSQHLAPIPPRPQQTEELSDPTPSTPGIPMPENPTPSEIQGGESEFPVEDVNQETEQNILPPVDQVDHSQPRPISEDGWAPEDDEEADVHTSGHELDKHLDQENALRHHEEVQELDSQARQMGA